MLVGLEMNAAHVQLDIMVQTAMIVCCVIPMENASKEFMDIVHVIQDGMVVNVIDVNTVIMV